MFSGLYQEEPEVFKSRVDLDEDDFNDKDIQEVLGVYDEVKLGLDGPEEGEEDEESEEDDDEYDDEDLEEEDESDKEQPATHAEQSNAKKTEKSD